MLDIILETAEAWESASLNNSIQSRTEIRTELWVTPGGTGEAMETEGKPGTRKEKESTRKERKVHIQCHREV